jgi:catechol 2,3-dioxygenase-like lactoylglutathione lyase family enzyme
MEQVMAAYLDHLMIPAKNKVAAAQLLARVLGVTSAPASIGPFHAVYVNEDLTIDFDEWIEEFPKGHYCFRVAEPEFDAILDRIRSLGIAFRSLPHGPVDHLVNTSVAGRIIYWGEPDGHVWELLTQSYARAKA